VGGCLCPSSKLWAILPSSDFDLVLNAVYLVPPPQDLRKGLASRVATLLRGGLVAHPDRSLFPAFSGSLSLGGVGEEGQPVGAGPEASHKL
jgi:hypothetical protein